MAPRNLVLCLRADLIKVVVRPGGRGHREGAQIVFDPTMPKSYRGGQLEPRYISSVQNQDHDIADTDSYIFSGFLFFTKPQDLKVKETELGTDKEESRAS